jgi:hypothetical protein
VQTGKPKSRWPVLIWMIVAQLLAAGSLVIWAFAAGISVMAFDQGSSPEAWRVVIAVWSYPILPLVLSIAAWIAFALRRNVIASILIALAFLPPVLLVIVVWVATATWSWFH